MNDLASYISCGASRNWGVRAHGVAACVVAKKVSPRMRSPRPPGHVIHSPLR